MGLQSGVGMSGDTVQLIIEIFLNTSKPSLIKLMKYLSPSRDALQGLFSVHRKRQ